MIPAYAPYEPATDDTSVGQVTSDIDRPNPTANGKSARVSVTTEMSGALMLRGVSRGTVLLTLNQLAVMNQNGIEIADALESVADNCTNKRLAQSLKKIHESVNSGRSLSTAVAAHGRYFPTTLAPLLAAAEATGEVPETLSNVCERLRGELQLRGAILGAMIYPLILILASSVVMGALVLGVLPQFSRVFTSLGRPIPASTQLLLDIGSFSRDHWMVIGSVVAGVVSGLFAMRHHAIVQRPLNRFLMYGPMIRSAYRPLQAGRAFRTLASMTGGGVPLLQSVRLARHTTRDRYWRGLLDRIEDSLIDGASASAVMHDADFLPNEAPQMMETAERTGRVSEVLENIGEYYEEDAGRRIKRLVVTMEPVIILIMGVVVAGVVMSLLLPLLDVSSVH